jgi:hypothetical protein
MVCSEGEWSGSGVGCVIHSYVHSHPQTSAHYPFHSIQFITIFHLSNLFAHSLKAIKGPLSILTLIYSDPSTSIYPSVRV